MSEDTCTKHNKPFDCLECTKRASVTANKTNMTVECEFGKFNFNTGINSISSLYKTHGDLRCSY